MQNVKSLRLAMVLAIALMLALGGALACLATPESAFAASTKVHKKAGCYVCSLDSGVKAKISGKKLIVKGKIKFGDSPYYPSNGWKKFKKAKHVFKLTKKTKYQVRDIPWGGTVKKYGKLRGGYFNFTKSKFNKVLKDAPFSNLQILVKNGKVTWMGWDSD